MFDDVRTSYNALISCIARALLLQNYQINIYILSWHSRFSRRMRTRDFTDSKKYRGALKVENTANNSLKNGKFYKYLSNVFGCIERGYCYANMIR